MIGDPLMHWTMNPAEIGYWPLLSPTENFTLAGMVDRQVMLVEAGTVRSAEALAVAGAP